MPARTWARLMLSAPSPAPPSSVERSARRNVVQVECIAAFSSVDGQALGGHDGIRSQFILARAKVDIRGAHDAQDRSDFRFKDRVSRHGACCRDWRRLVTQSNAVVASASFNIERAADSSLIDMHAIVAFTGANLQRATDADRTVHRWFHGFGRRFRGRPQADRHAVVSFAHADRNTALEADAGENQSVIAGAETDAGASGNASDNDLTCGWRRFGRRPARYSCRPTHG